MNKTHTLLLSSVSALLLAAPAFANEPDTNLSLGLMGSQPAAPVVVSDSTLKKAIETLIKQQEKKIDLKKKIPVKLDNPLGAKPRDTDRVLILGDAVPM